MAARQREMTDSMHYESRQIRDALAASNARLKSARCGRVPPDLQPQMGAAMLQAWEGLSSTGHLDQGDNLASGNPLYQQMREALLAFEREVGYTSPARERAFFSALRTQLMEAGAQRDDAQREMQIAATFKWFSKHKPKGPEADPITAAVLASSLAVEAVATPTLQDLRPPSLSGTPAGGGGQAQVRLSAPHSPSPVSGSASPAAAAGGAGAGGNKHAFFDVYSRAHVSSNPNLAAAMAAGALAAAATPGSAALRPTSARGASPGSRPAAPVGRSNDREESPSLSINHPLAMYPSVAGGVPARHTASPSAGGASAADAVAAAAGASAGPPRARFATPELYAPAKLVRSQELDDLDHRAAVVAAAAAAAGVANNSAGTDGGASSSRGGIVVHPRPWISGPHKASIATGGTALGVGTGGGAGRRGDGGGAAREGLRQGPDDDDEIRMLRSKWSAMEAKTTQSVADVQSKVAEWTLQRARLEEEIVRRQEASRISPLNGNVAGSVSAGPVPPWQIDGLRRSDFEEGMLAPGTLSPYANANADLAAATAAAAAGPGALGFVMPAGGLHGAAAAALGASMRLRHAEIGAYDRGRAELMDRLSQLGVQVSGNTLDRALRPLEDRPFLDCIARLPRPGEHLVSRPDSVRLPAAKKKLRSKSASKKRPPSGRS